MPSTITGNSSTDPTTTPSVSGPASGDAINSGPIDAYLQTILNGIAWLRANAGLLGGSNTWSASQLFNAAVTLANALTLNSGNVSLTASALQSILKGGTGKLDIGTSTANDLEFLVNGAVKAVLSASTGRLGGLTDPASAQDAATKNYVDPIAARAWGKLTLGAAGAVTVTKGYNVASASYSGAILTITLTTALADVNGVVVALPFAAAAGQLTGQTPATNQVRINRTDFSSTAINYNAGEIVQFAVFN